jgi:hypothetical protein
MRLLDLLKRAYFSRVWVIQELLVSQRAVIRVGNIDFHADADTMSRISNWLSGRFNWGATRAPWVQYLAQKALNPSRNTDIFSLAALTLACMASDPRD